MLRTKASSGRPGPWASRTGAEDERLPCDAGDDADSGRVRLAIRWAAPGTSVMKSFWAWLAASEKLGSPVVIKSNMHES